MKQTIEWHESCLKNSEQFLLKEKEEVLQAIKRLNRTERDIAFTKLQILKAKSEGKDGFDNERYKLDYKGFVVHPIHSLATE